MPRRPDIIPKYSLTLQVPMDLMDKLRLLLWSEAEGRVPHGGYAAFFTRLLNEHFAKLESQANETKSDRPV